jgi:hypothetical protein
MNKIEINFDYFTLSIIKYVYMYEEKDRVKFHINYINIDIIDMKLNSVKKKLVMSK